MGDSAGRVNQQPFSDLPAPRKPLRLWPGVVAVALQWLVMFGLPVFVPEQGGTAIIAGFAARCWSCSGGCSSAARPGPSGWARSS